MCRYLMKSCNFSNDIISQNLRWMDTPGDFADIFHKGGNFPDFCWFPAQKFPSEQVSTL